MPGSRPNDIEKKLAARWDSANYQGSMLLERIQVQGSPGLRGQSDLTVAFNYPVTVVCGRNGSGKSTVLALAALGFHSAGLPSGPSLQGDYYTFRDFFFKGPGDPDIAGVEIAWHYRNAPKESLRIKKQSKHWMRYARRPGRSVYYVGAYRAVPAIEQTVLRHHFGSGRKSPKQTLDGGMRSRLGEIMGRTYDGAELHASQRHAIRLCDSGGTYSSFNMGAGEDVLINLLFVLQSAPRGSLIVIEEIELGLHPAAVKKLAQHILEIACDKHLQVVVSSHSEHFLDAMPKRARVLLQWVGTGSIAVPEPTTRFAMGELGGAATPELIIYCEDECAATLAQVGLAGGLRQRVRLAPIGSDSQLTKVAAHVHLAAGTREKAMLLWDGDVASSDITQWMQSLAAEHPNHGVSWVALPGGLPPERWVVETLDCPDGVTSLANRLRESEATASGWIQQLLACGDHHDIPRTLCVLANLPSLESATRELCQAAADMPANPLAGLSIAVQGVLDGGQVGRVL